MNNIPPGVKKEVLKDRFYDTCSRRMLLNDHQCSGRITWEHAMIFAGRQVQKKWAIIPLCEFAHGVNTFQDKGILDKDINRWIALNRATDKELEEISKATSYEKMKEYLNGEYGIPDFSYYKEGPAEASLSSFPSTEPNQIEVVELVPHQTEEDAKHQTSSDTIHM